MCKGSSNTTSTTTSQPPAAVLNAYQNVVGQAQNVAGQPLRQYSGPLIAGFTPQQGEAFNTIENSQGIAQPYINSAANMAGSASAPITPMAFSPGAVGTYFNPYVGNVVNATQAQFNNANAQQQQTLAGQAINAGAWGGDRVGIAQAELANQQQLAQAPVIAGLYNTGYGQALGEFNTQQQAGIGAQEASGWLGENAAFALGNLGQEAQSTALTGASANLQAGGLEQQLAQEQLNIPYEYFQQQQAYPFQTTNWLAGITEGIGGNSGGTSSTTTPGPSTGSQIAGLGLTGLGVLGATGAFGSNGYLTGASGLFSKRGGRIPPLRHYDMGGALPALPDLTSGYVPSSNVGGQGGNSIPKAPVAGTNNDMAGAQNLMNQASLISKILNASRTPSWSESNPNNYSGPMDPGVTGLPFYSPGSMDSSSSGFNNYARGGRLPHMASGGSPMISGFTMSPGRNIAIPELTDPTKGMAIDPNTGSVDMRPMATYSPFPTATTNSFGTPNYATLPGMPNPIVTNFSGGTPVSVTGGNTNMAGAQSSGGQGGVGGTVSGGQGGTQGGTGGNTGGGQPGSAGTGAAKAAADLGVGAIAGQIAPGFGALKAGVQLATDPNYGWMQALNSLSFGALGSAPQGQSLLGTAMERAIDTNPAAFSASPASYNPADATVTPGWGFGMSPGSLSSIDATSKAAATAVQTGDPSYGGAPSAGSGGGTPGTGGVGSTGSAGANASGATGGFGASGFGTTGATGDTAGDTGNTGGGGAVGGNDGSGNGGIGGAGADGGPGGVMAKGGFIHPWGARRHFDFGGNVGADISQTGAIASGQPPGGGNPLYGQMFRQFSQLPAEKLQELSVRLPPSSAQGMLVRRALMAKQMNPTQGAQTNPSQAAPLAPMAGAGTPQPVQAPGAPLTPGTQPQQPGMGQQPQPMMAGGGRLHYDDGGTVADMLGSAYDAARNWYNTPGSPADLAAANSSDRARPVGPPPGIVPASATVPHHNTIPQPPPGQPTPTLTGNTPTDFNPSAGMMAGATSSDMARGLTPQPHAQASPGPAGENPTPDRPNSRFASNPWTALIAAGLGTMAGRSPHALVNVGQGGLEGLKYAETQQAQETREQQIADEKAWREAETAARSRGYDLEARKLEQALAQHKDTITLETEKMKNEQLYREAELKNAAARLGIEQQRANAENVQGVPSIRPDPNDPTKTQYGMLYYDRKHLEKPPVFMEGATGTSAEASMLRAQATQQNAETNAKKAEIAKTRGQTATEWRYNAWLASHQGDTQGALDYAAGHRQMTDQDIRKSAYNIATKDPNVASDKAALDARTNEIFANIKNGIAAPADAPAPEPGFFERVFGGSSQAAPAAQPKPAAQPQSQAAAPALPPQAVAQLKEGIVTTFGNGQKWTLEGGKPKQVP